MTPLSLQDEELLADKVELFPVLYDKTVKGYREKDVITSAWVKVAEKLDFIANGCKAQGLFKVLKKKYLRKRKELKDAKRSGAATDVVEKAERAFKPYHFLSWLDKFVQTRKGRTNLPQKGTRKVVEINFASMADYTDDDDDDDDEDDVEGNIVHEPLKMSKKMTGKKRAKKSPSTKEAFMNEMEFALMRSLNESIAEKRRKVSLKEDDAEDLFCKALALELKELPKIAKCMAKNEIRNVIFKYQMSTMKNQNEGLAVLPTSQQLNTANSPSCQSPNSSAPFRSDINSPGPSHSS